MAFLLSLCRKLVNVTWKAGPMKLNFEITHHARGSQQEVPGTNNETFSAHHLNVSTAKMEIKYIQPIYHNIVLFPQDHRLYCGP
jgi:hypothetical protein